MTPEELNEWLALNVMGWCQIWTSTGSMPGYDGYVNAEDATYSFDDWSPTTDIAQAFECLEALETEGYGVFKFGPSYWGCNIATSLGESHESREMAICIAVAKAAGAENV